MKITVICDVLGNENNGTTIAAMNLIRFLKSAGHTVTVVCPDPERQGEEGFITVRRINFGIFNSYVHRNGVGIAYPDTSVLKGAVKDADVVHLFTPFFLSQRAAMLAVEAGIPVTAGFHCQAENFSSHIFLMNNESFNKDVYRYFYRHLYSYCTAVHYPTQFICDVFEKTVGVKTNHYVISNGVNRRFVRCPTEKPEEYSDSFVILFTGRYSHEKSHSVLIKAAACSKYTDRIQLIFAGSGPLEKKLRREARRLLVKQPLFRFFSREEMLDVLNYSDLYVHPAEIEIEAISCLEAISCGLVPIIADSPRSATKYFALSEHNLFRHGEPDSLAAQIDYWIENPEKKEQCRLKYLDYAGKFDQDECMRQMEKMLYDAVQTKGRKK